MRGYTGRALFSFLGRCKSHGGPGTGLAATISALLLLAGLAGVAPAGGASPLQLQGRPDTGAPQPAVASPLIAWEGDQVHLAIAGNGADEYLAVWEDHHWLRYGWDIYGLRINANGQSLAPQFPITPLSDYQNSLAPAVAYNSALSEFLVVWEYEYSTTDHDIYGQRVAANGSLIGGRFAVSTRSNFESNPVVVYNVADDEYLVIWQLRTGSDEFTQNDIYGQRLDNGGRLQGAAIAIDTSLFDEQAPDVAYSALNQYLVVWQDKQSGSGEYDITGQRLAANGSLLGGPISICTWEYDQVKPRLAYNGQDSQFLVVWEDHHWGWGADWDIYGQRLNAAGSAAGGNFGISWDGAQQRESPAVTYQPVGNQYLVAWEYAYSASDHDIYRRRVSSAGTLLEDEVVVANPGSMQARPAVASAASGLSLVGWEDGRDSATLGIDLYADIVPATSTPTATRTATPSSTRTATPTATSTSTVASTATTTATSSRTGTPTATSTATSGPTNTPTATPTCTSTPAATATSTATSSPTAPLATSTHTATATLSATATRTATPSATPTATATLTARGTPTATIMPVGVQIEGRVILERRSSNAGATVCVGSQCVTTGSDGRYEVSGLAAGVYTVTASRAGYLRSERSVTIATAPLTVPGVTLLAGDINQDGCIEVADLTIACLAWNGIPGAANWDERADITGDGIVDVLDAVAIQFNWDKIAPVPWP